MVCIFSARRVTILIVMKVFTRDYRITGDYHPLWNEYFVGMEPCVLDIEATGLDSSRSKCVLVGLLMRSDKGVTVTQFLAENHYEEGRVLDAAMEFFDENNVGYLITFNGAAYDIPFMNARLAANAADTSLFDDDESSYESHPLELYDFDLYRFLRKCTDLKSRTGSLSQKSVEDYYGILSDRGDTITGRESVTLFDQYAVSGNSTIEKIILTHNREDVLHLHRLMYLALADVPDLHQALAAYGLPAADGRLSVRPHIKEPSSVNKPASLKINGEQIKAPVSCAYFPDDGCPATAVFNAGTRSFEIELPLGTHGCDHYLDLSFLIKRSATLDASKDVYDVTGSVQSLRNDSDCVNDYLIINPRTVSLASRVISELYLSM